jgi:hypothetical protein
MPQTCSKAGAIIQKPVSDARIALFINSKKKILDDALYPQTENSFLVYSFDVFIRMLELFAYRRDMYNGIRVYFASYLSVDGDPGCDYIPAGQEGKLTLIFVPTKQGKDPDGSPNIENIDDIDNCYTICNNVLFRLSNPTNVPSRADTASNWIRSFQSKIANLEKDGKTYTGSTSFRETRSLWYSMQSIAGNNADDAGLISYARCMSQTPDDPTNPVDGVIAKFASFLASDGKPYPYYQMTLIFDLHQKNDPPMTGISFSSLPFGIKGVDTDTGLPCPPDDGCGIGSSQFPQP